MVILPDELVSFVFEAALGGFIEKKPQKKHGDGKLDSGASMIISPTLFPSILTVHLNVKGSSKSHAKNHKPTKSDQSYPAFGGGVTQKSKSTVKPPPQSVTHPKPKSKGHITDSDEGKSIPLTLLCIYV